MSGIARSAEEVLSEKGYVVISTAGYSMLPMLRDRKDTVELRRVTERPEKYDVVLFKKGNNLVLHRIIKVTPDGYIIRGDNCAEKDALQPGDIIGVLYSFTRSGKRHTVNDADYLIYSRLTVFFNPIMRLLQRIKGKIKRIVPCI